MPLTHYPKAPEGFGLFGAMLWYGKGDPRNTMESPLAPEDSADCFGSAVNWTRFQSTAYCDQPCEISYAFSNEEYILVPEPIQVPRYLAYGRGSGPTVLTDPSLPPNLQPLISVREASSVYPWAKSGWLREVTTEDLPNLSYDGVSAVVNYVPAKDGKSAMGCHPFVTISGAFLRVRVINKGSDRVQGLRIYIKSSVF